MTPTPGPPVVPSATEVVLDAGAVARTYRVDADSVRTVSIRGGQGPTAVAGPELAVVIDGVRHDDRDLTLVAAPDMGDGTQLSWTMTTSDEKVQVTVVVAARPDSGVIRKWAVVTGAGRLDRIELELWEGVEVEGWASIEPEPAAGGGVMARGQPVFGPGFFAGIEHPGAENLATATGCRCSIAYGVALDAVQAVVSPTAVVGSGDFFEYLETIRPHGDRVVVVAGIDDRRGPPDGTVTARRQLEAWTSAAARDGLEIDHWCLADGWDGGWAAGTDLDDLWARLDPARFPGGLAGLEEVSGQGRMGLWIGPSGGNGARGDARVAWAGERSGEIDGDGRLCVAGDLYQEALRQTLTRWTAAGIRYWQLDGVRFTCPRSDHGHPPGESGPTVQIDRFLRLLTDSRAADPAVVLAFIAGSNPSPWWLPAVDFLSIGSFDGPEAGSEAFATAVDARLHLYRNCSIPVSAFLTPHRPPADLDRDGWERHCWLAVGRGAHHHQLDVDPAARSDVEWQAWARAQAWGRRYRRVLGRSRMVLGDPSGAEVYGFASRYQGEAVLCLRNPAAQAQTVRVVPAEVLGFEADAPLRLALVHGPAHPPARVLAGRPLEIELDPFEVLLLTAASGDERPALQAVVDGA